MNRFVRLGLILFSILSVTATLPALARDRHAITIKGGQVWLNDDSQELARRSVDIEETDDLWAIAFESRGARSGFGVEFYNHAHHWESRLVGDDRPSGRIELTVINFVARRYIRPTDYTRLFFGAGLGFGRLKNEFIDTSTGAARSKYQVSGVSSVQLNAGFELDFGGLGLFTEFKGIGAFPFDDDAGDDPLRRDKYPRLSGRVAMVGLSFLF